MFGHRIWRPAAVTVVMGAAAFLPQGNAIAATPGTIDTVSCSQLSAEIRNGSLNCTPLRHDGVDGLFIGPVSPSTSPAGGSASGSASTSSTTGGSSDDSASGSSGRSGHDDSDDDESDSDSGSSDSGSSSSNSDSDDSSDSGSSDSNSSDSSGSDDSSSTSTSGSSTDSSSTGTSGGSVSTTAGVTLGAASCPSSVTGSTGTSAATGSVDTSGNTTSGNTASGNTTGGTSTDTSGAASVSNLTGTTATTGTAGTTSAADTAASSVADATTAAAAPAVGTANIPADVIDLAPWYLTLPTGAAGSPETIENPALAKFTNEAFKLTDKRDGVVFSARAGGVTTKNSSYPRSELREMNGSEHAAWSNTTGSHTLDVCEAIMKTPTVKPEVVAAQIHDASDDVMQIRLEGKTLMVQYNDGKTETVIDPNYVLGTPYNVRIVAEGGKVDVLYNGEKKAELPLSGSGWYWKVGAYVQSSPEKGESPDATGEVAVYSLKVVHA
ncbi:polysaccharide lyase family 7 protein [Pseudonocardia charpentierae]|uniref:Polysaccharide lyase family 7 protein n=1 Tax=Pseudonocardia charpentierae TaxID=3075545 RepID=A0ABU2NK01_9PSEU|nr:polysaccharide lyase family 7 protein [Pseudonocardia sp. DSM 45834]MDT0352929.1 polysaccharide lyase family 7 protein [Pseudonocardia sp. DSM 45834]